MIKNSEQTNTREAKIEFYFMWPFLVFLGLYTSAILLGKKFDGDFIGNSTFGNFLSLEILKNDLFAGLIGMHSQPPLLNLMYGIGAQFYPHHVLVIQILWVLSFMLTLYCIQKTIFILCKSKAIASGGTIFYLLIPSTFAYVFWSYNTVLMQMSYSVLVLGITRVWKQIERGEVWTCFGLFLLFLIKTPYSGFIVIPIMLVLTGKYLISKRKRQTSKAEILLLSLFIVASTITQLHYVIDFKQTSLSSWSSNHLWRNLTTGLTTNQKIEISSKNPCFADIIASGNSNSGLLSYPHCVDKYQNIEVNTTKAATIGNTNNSKDKLLGSFAVRDLVTYTLPRYWGAYSDSIFGSPQTPGSLSNFLGITIYQDKPQELIRQNLLLFSCIFFLFLYLIINILFPRKYFSKYILTLLAILFFGIAYSLFGESMENDRYKVEMNPLMYILSISIVHIIFDKYRIRGFTPLIRARLQNLLKVLATKYHKSKRS